MANKDIDDFLSKLFASEGGGQTDVVNRLGYLGKYQFGEPALVDLGYYQKKGKFNNDWTGTWAGKNGIHSKDDFLKSPNAQDLAAKEWVRLLCSRMKHFKLEKFIGQEISGVKITESGIIAGAHLKGFGSTRNPGVSQFLKSNGKIDPSDANGTRVSRYVSKFADYDLGCCGKVDIHFLDKEKQPIAGVRYKATHEGRTLANGKTDSNGRSATLKNIQNQSIIEIWIERIEGGFKKIFSFLAKDSATTVTLVSPKFESKAKLEHHEGEKGKYKRKHHHKPSHHQDSGQGAQGNSRANNEKQTQHNRDRNSKGHPVTSYTTDKKTVKPDLNKLLEIMKDNVTLGNKAENISGLVAVGKIRKGQKISQHTKPVGQSLGKCYKYVKIGLLASGYVDAYLGGEHAKDAGPHLMKMGFINIQDDEKTKVNNPHDAPRGAVIVYGVTDGTPHGHIEIKGSDGFYSDYFSTRARTEATNLKEHVDLLSGRGRVVAGIWIKNI